MYGTVLGPDKYHLDQIRFKLECPIWTYGYSDRPFWSSGNKKCFESNIDATTIECDIDQESSVNSLKSPPFHAKRSCINCYVIILEWPQMTLFLTSTKMKWSYTLKTGHGPSKNNRREKLTFDGYILLKNYVGWSLEINTIKLQIRISEEFVCKTCLLTGF